MNFYNELTSEQEKQLDEIIKENNFLSFQIDLLSKKVAKAIKEKGDDEELDIESNQIMIEIKKVNSEIDELETFRKKYFSDLTTQNEQESRIKLVKLKIKALKKKNQELKEAPTLSELFNQLQELKNHESMLKSAIKAQKHKIQSLKSKDSNPHPDPDPISTSKTPDILAQLHKNEDLKSSHIRVKKAWKLILNEADIKNRELEEEVAELNSELKLRTKSCRVKKLQSRRLRNFS